MTSEPFADIDLYGRQELQGLLEQNRAAGLAVPEATPSVLGGLAHAASQNLGLVAPETVNWQPFQETLAIASKLFNRIGLTPPGERELREAGIDFAKAEAAFGDMERDGLEPMLVLAPALALEGPHGWSALYDQLQKDQTIPGNPLKNQSDGAGLWVNDDVKQNWNQINHYGSTNQDGSSAHTPTTTGPDGHATGWQLAVVPATAQPPELNVPHTANDANHPSIGIYLTLQANRIQAGETPIDSAHYTWLGGDFSSASQAPCGYWRPGDGQVLVYSHDVGRRRDNLGVRLPVWG